MMKIEIFIFIAMALYTLTVFLIGNNLPRNLDFESVRPVELRFEITEDAAALLKKKSDCKMDE